MKQVESGNDAVRRSAFRGDRGNDANQNITRHDHDQELDRSYQIVGEKGTKFARCS